MTDMFTGVTLSPSNYDNLLISWASQTPSLQNNVVFNGGNSKYSSTALSARNTTLIGTHTWIITDAGPETFPNITDITLTDEVTLNQINSTQPLEYGNNFTINVTAINDIDTVWVKFWQGLVALWEGFLDLISGDLFSKKIEVNESWIGEVNYTITVNDTSNNIVQQNGTFKVFSCNSCTNCNALLETNSIVQLTQNITNQNGNCIVIKNSSRTFDCNGYTIDGDNDINGAAVVVDTTTYGSLNDIVIENCNIQEFQNGAVGQNNLGSHP